MINIDWGQVGILFVLGLALVAVFCVWVTWKKTKAYYCCVCLFGFLSTLLCSKSQSQDQQMHDISLS